MPEIHTYGADASAPDPDGGLESTEDGGAPAELPDDEEIVGYYILDGRTVYQRQKRSDAGVEPDAAARHDGAPDAGEEPEAPRVTPQLDRWPMREELHPAIKDIPASAETSIASVADYVVRAERDPLQRVKALHDYVADRVVYDVEALRSGNFPPQTPEEVFRSHKAVCAGYAQLLSALGQAAGLEIPVVVGVAKTEKEPESHAWNAAKVGDRWFLIDATWDAGSVGEHGFEKRYRTEHLFAPPAIFVLAHLPRDAGWQLLPNAVALSEFVRQPALDPLFFIHGLAFTTPVRRQMDTARWATLELDNPKEIPLLAKLAGEGSPGSCEVLPLPARRSRIRCEMPSPAVYRMTLFVATGTEGLTTHYTSAASVTFNNSI